jgi:hypothetical protein
MITTCLGKESSKLTNITITGVFATIFSSLTFFFFGVKCRERPTKAIPQKQKGLNHMKRVKNDS